MPSRSGEPFSKRHALLLLAVLLPVLPLVLGRGFLVQHDLFASDLIHNQFPYRAFAGRCLRAGEFPLWLPGVFSGVPYFAQIEAGPLYLPNVILFGTLEPYTALNLSIVFTFLLGAAGVFLLARHYGADRVSASLGGLVFTLSGFNVSHVKHMNMHESAAFLPWMALCLEKAWRSGSAAWFAGLSLATAFQVSAGHPQIAYYSLLFLTVRTAVLAIQEARTGGKEAGKTEDRPWKRGGRAARTLGIALALALGIGICAVQLATAWEFNRNSIRSGGPDWQFASGFPYYVPDLLTFLNPAANGTTARMDYRGTIEWENYGYFGLVPLALVFVAIIFVRRRTVWFHAAALAGSIVLVLGPATPLYRWLWQWLPGMRLFRFPTRFLLIVALAAAVLSALGSTWLGNRIRAARGPSLARAVLLGLFLVSAIDLSSWQRMRLPIDDLRAWRRETPVAAAIRQRDGGGRVYSLLGPESWYHAWEESRGFQGGFEPYRRAGELPFGNLSLIPGLANAEGYTNMLDQRTASFWMWYNTPLLPKVFQPEKYDPASERITPAFHSLLNLAGVRYVITPVPLRNTELVLLHDGPARVYENRSALPRAYLAYEWRGVSSIDEAAAWMFAPEHDAIPAIEGAGSSGEGRRGAIGDAAVAGAGGPDRVEIHVHPVAEAYLILTDSFDPGWTAEVDGRRAEIQPANGYQRAVKVDANARTVVFSYRPPGIGAGGAVSAISILAVGAWISASRFRPRRPGRP